MESNKKTKFILAVLVLIALYFGYFGITNWNEKRSALAILTTDELKNIYSRALEYENKIKQSPKDFELYNAAGFNWKSLGDATGKSYFYKKAIKIYQKALNDEKSTSALFYLNSGNIYRYLGEFEKADKQFMKAIEMNPGDDVMHRAKIDLYLAWDKKTPGEILEVFDAAIRMLLFSVNVNLEKAAYLTKLGRYEEAIRIYEGVKAGYPDQPNLNEKISELKVMIEKRKN